VKIVVVIDITEAQLRRRSQVTNGSFPVDARREILDLIATRTLSLSNRGRAVPRRASPYQRGRRPHRGASPRSVVTTRSVADDRSESRHVRDKPPPPQLTAPARIPASSAPSATDTPLVRYVGLVLVALDCVSV